MMIKDLLSQISNVNLSSTSDRWSWTNDSSGTFTVKSMKTHMLSNMHGPNFWSFPWNKLAPLKVNILGWRLEMDRIPTTDQLRKRNITTATASCRLCNLFDETAEHLFLHCSFAQSLWFFVTSWCNLPSNGPGCVKDLLEFHKHPMIAPSKRNLISLVVLAYIWVVWKCGNDSIFSNKQPSLCFATRELKSISFSWLSNPSEKLCLDWDRWNTFNF